MHQCRRIPPRGGPPGRGRESGRRPTARGGSAEKRWGRRADHSRESGYRAC
ncbi:hypothetical protein SLNWT_5024 [Streptomyces albus]|uniref:Uncharacterized protein n=1 Tax=Streptomyces albus (strain ATCC 21838 / DSM 41398 / FERM P-419 / JCM 4703 / NBRC 107858) TaxID=1081613 RepID=A0A0B5F1F3_STRA4|nr:hypothetical protein SLNWT_5024 [Streptomyces albus]AOU79704.1 hypothetical protein SLNHY_5013 [Streptomyces albus]AYN35428.1 hypothetical protein DUI70_4930 [Streptomyces albus]